MNISMTKTTHPGKLPPADRLGFGSVFTDHMFLMNYTDREGWHNARIVPFGPISISPAASVLHYGTEVFEGLKAYRRPDGAVQLFRPWENVARLNRSCDRLGLPRIDERDGLQALRELVKMDAAWVPSAPGMPAWYVGFAEHGLLRSRPLTRCLTASAFRAIRTSA